jgi:hypothetical protein
MTSTDSTHSAPRLRRSWRLSVVGLAVAGAVALGLAAPADARVVTAQGATIGASAVSSMTAHQLTVRPYATVQAGWTSQYVVYAVATYERETGMMRYFGFYGPYLVQPAASGSVCMAIVGCGSYSMSNVPSNLPTQTFWGVPGHHYDIWVRTGHWTGAAYSYSGWVLIDYCIIGTMQGQACVT